MITHQYLNGGWTDSKDLKISAYDLSVTRGFGVFDFLRTYKNKPFMLNDHIDRFFNSLKILGMKSIRTRKEITDIVYEGIRRNKFNETNIKIIQTGGMSDDGVIPNGKHVFIAMFSPAIIYPNAYYEKGIKLITAPMGRIYPGAKSLNYMAGVIALQQAKKINAVEALYVDKTYIYECVTSNFFAVINSQLVTTKHAILRGITRKVIFTIAKELKISVIERDLLVTELAKLDEAFITASNKEVMPVVKIDNTYIGNGKPGIMTRTIMASFKAYVQDYAK